MEIVLCGQRSFGRATLEVLLERGEDVRAVVAPPGDPLANEAAERGLPCQTDADPALCQGADLIIAAHSHAYIGRRTRLSTRLGAVGYHPSLLPRHRGRDAVRWTVHMGDGVTGGTWYWLDDGVDTGPVAAQTHILVRPGEDHHQLWRRLFDVGLVQLGWVLDCLKQGTVVATPQDEMCATWEPSMERPPLHRPELIEIGPMPEGYELRIR